MGFWVNPPQPLINVSHSVMSLVLIKVYNNISTPHSVCLEVWTPLACSFSLLLVSMLQVSKILFGYKTFYTRNKQGKLLVVYIPVDNNRSRSWGDNAFLVAFIRPFVSVPVLSCLNHFVGLEYAFYTMCVSQSGQYMGLACRVLRGRPLMIGGGGNQEKKLFGGPSPGNNFF